MNNKNTLSIKCSLVLISKKFKSLGDFGQSNILLSELGVQNG